MQRTEQETFGKCTHRVRHLPKVAHTASSLKIISLDRQKESQLADIYEITVNTPEMRKGSLRGKETKAPCCDDALFLYLTLDSRL